MRPGSRPVPWRVAHWCGWCCRVVLVLPPSPPLPVTNDMTFPFLKSLSVCYEADCESVLLRVVSFTVAFAAPLSSLVPLLPLSACLSLGCCCSDSDGRRDPPYARPLPPPPPPDRHQRAGLHFWPWDSRLCSHFWSRSWSRCTSDGGLTVLAFTHTNTQTQSTSYIA